ncbi:MAG: pantoate--beta-alanine ligase [Armatimonadota bacterium]|nr:pantoate--beta-alanine ligase [Armatimonadota bacterium]
MQELAKNWCCGGATIGFVPTMGSLHEAHLAMVRTACAECTKCVASIFVNPLQFGANEDFHKYPRPFERDRELLESVGCDVLFAPGVSGMYGGDAPIQGPPGHGPHTFVEVTVLGEIWEGVVRPGHLRGVATVVTKLFNIVQPDRAYFGEKDYQQLKVVQRMVNDLNFGITIVPIPTAREADGLAVSSRNQYLTPEQRAAAPVLYRALQTGAEMAAQGERDVAIIGMAMHAVCESEPLVKVQYITIVDTETLLPLRRLDDHPARALIAARIGDTRLIDNVPIIVEDEMAPSQPPSS